ncbi:MAG: DUF1501 domain-containing protein [Pseudomonadota bacterium]
MITRRNFIKSAALFPGAFYLPSLAATELPPANLVVVFMRGAVDGLSMVPPVADRHYYDSRRDIAIPAPGSAGKDSALELDGRFGLHPALRPFHTLFQQGRLAALPGCGSPVNSRSHFDAQDFMESGMAGDRQVQDGWMNRVMAQLKRESMIDAVAMTTTLPRSLQGKARVLNIPDLDQFEIGYASARGSIRRDETAEWLLERLYTGSPLADTTQVSLAAVRELRARKYQSTSVAYPDGEFSHQLKQLAQLIKSNLGLRLGFVEIGGWDTHANQGGSVGQLAGNLYRLSYGLEAFFKDLGELGNNTVVITLSEFGRTVKQNGNRGTDHGHGTSFFVMGKPVRGGRVLGTMPELHPDALYQGRDLPVTTDYRDVIADLVREHLGVQDLGQVFPGYRPSGVGGLLV